MEKNILENIGLTEAESKVYLALLRIGASTIGAIIKESGVSNSKIYDILDRLNKKGLVGVSISNNRKSFEAENPTRIKELIEAKKQEIKQVENLIPELEETYKYAEPVQEAEILQGVNGIKTAVELMINSMQQGDIYYILGARNKGNERLQAYHKEWHDIRIKKKIACKILYEREDKIEKIKKNPLIEIKYLPKDIKNPTMIDITKNYVAIIITEDRPLCFLIKNKKVASGYLNYFELLWKISKSG